MHDDVSQPVPAAAYGKELFRNRDTTTEHAPTVGGVIDACTSSALTLISVSVPKEPALYAV